VRSAGVYSFSFIRSAALPSPARPRLSLPPLSRPVKFGVVLIICHPRIPRSPVDSGSGRQIKRLGHYFAQDQEDEEKTRSYSCSNQQPAVPADAQYTVVCCQIQRSGHYFAQDQEDEEEEKPAAAAQLQQPAVPAVESA